MTNGRETEPPEGIKFSEEGRRVLVLSREEAFKFCHNYIGTEHLLLGLIREGTVAEIFGNLNVNLLHVRSAVEFIIGQGGDQPTGELETTPQAKKIIELAIDEARRDKAREVTPFHLLAGVVRQGEGVAAGVLESMGVTLKELSKRLKIQKILNGHETPLPEIVNRLEETLEDPKIDQPTKDRITTIISEIINLAQKQQ